MIEEELTQYLTEKYQPIGIILFGSRATEKYPENTDWDLFVFTDKTEGDVDDFGDFREWKDEYLEVSIVPPEEMTDDTFLLDTATHPVRDIKVLYDNSNGLVDRIIERTRKAYEAGPSPLIPRTRELYRKILTKYIRKAESRGDQPETIFFATSQFFIFAVRYWFEVQQLWPRPIYEAMPFIEDSGTEFAKHLRELIDGNISTGEKIDAMKYIREDLFSN